MNSFVNIYASFSHCAENNPSILFIPPFTIVTCTLVAWIPSKTHSTTESKNGKINFR